MTETVIGINSLGRKQMTEMIRVRGITKSFGKQEVLRGVELTVARGEIVALLGENGAGKTTLINILTTLVQPDGGTASVAGYDVVRDRRAVKAQLSLTGQSAAVDEILTADENLRMMARLAGLSAPEAARRSRELLERFGLAGSARKRVKTFSGGMRRRLDLAISLLTTPAVVFLDEPTTGLDPASRQELWVVIRHLADNGTTVFLTTQYLEEADQLADRIVVLRDGRIVAEGTPGELKSRVGGEVVEVRDAAGALVGEVPTDGTAAGLRAALDALDDPTASITLRRPTLDDVFLSLTGKVR
jgi:ABC-2 type transport system ATP-binding protein